jgi:hypothetical protein
MKSKRDLPIQERCQIILAAIAMYKERGEGLPGISQSTFLEVIAEAAEGTTLEKLLKD